LPKASEAARPPGEMDDAFYTRLVSDSQPGDRATRLRVPVWAGDDVLLLMTGSVGSEAGGPMYRRDEEDCWSCVAGAGGMVGRPRPRALQRAPALTTSGTRWNFGPTFQRVLYIWLTFFFCNSSSLGARIPQNNVLSLFFFICHILV
jgi:hypothetical protein